MRVNDELVLDAGTCLVDHVFPRVPVRPVLSLPPRLRYQLAWNHDLCRAVVGVSVRAILRFLQHRAREAPVLAGLAAASVQGRVALGPRAGERVRRCGIRPIYTVTPQTAASTNTIRDEITITIHGVASAAKVEFDVFELRWKRSHDPIEVSEGSILAGRSPREKVLFGLLLFVG